MPDDLHEEYDALQTMHDVEHRKEVELEKERYAPVFRSRCRHCDRSFSDPEGANMCPDCGQRSGVFRKREEWEDAA